MASKVDIANYALALLGQDPITDLTEDSKAARTLNLRFDSVRDAVLRGHPWNFAVQRDSRAALATAPAWGWTYAYNLPSDFLRLLDFNPETRDPYELETQDGERVLLTDASSCDIKYIARVTDTTLYDSLFIEALAARLAWASCVAITGSAELLAKLKQDYEDKLGEARSIDGQENPSVVLGFDEFTDAHLGYMSSWRPISSS